MLFLILIAIAIPGLQNQSTPKAEPFDDHAIVTPRRTEKTRGRGEDRYTVVTIHPVITGLRPSVLKNIRKELEFKKIVGGSYLFFKNHWAYGFDYRVTYNRNHILALKFTWNAYFRDYDRGLAFDLMDGSLIKAEDLFREDQVPELVKLIDQRLKDEMEQIIRDYKDPDLMREMLKGQGPMPVTADTLAEFELNDKGITFHYEAGFHHAAQWFEPKGRYFFKYSELKNYLKPNTVVSQFVE